MINNYISKYVIVKELICIIIFIDFKRTKKRSHTKQTHGKMEKKDANKTKTETNISRAQKWHAHSNSLFHTIFSLASLSSSDFIWDAQKIRKEKSNDSMKMTILMYEWKISSETWR